MTAPLTAEQQRQSAMPIRLSCDGASLTEQSVSRIALRRKEHVAHQHMDVRGDIALRTFCQININGLSLLADVKTGTLYDATTGECLGSRQNRIVFNATAQPRKLKHSKHAAREIEGWMNNARREAA